MPWIEYCAICWHLLKLFSFDLLLTIACLCIFDVCESCQPYMCAWWRHQMETFSALLALCAGNSPVPVNSPHKGQWRGALMFTLICARINDWINNREAGVLRCYRAHYDVIVMELNVISQEFCTRVICAFVLPGWVMLDQSCSRGPQYKQSGRSPNVVALFTATNLCSYIIELLQLHDTFKIKFNYA